MSFETSEEIGTDGRRAAHVKWDGKTIALGTFSAQEAAEKCSRAKALTKKWRTTMVPKPDVEWVKTTLERLNIRVVNDRPGRRKKRAINEVEKHQVAGRPSSSPSMAQSMLNNQLSTSGGQNINMGNIGHDPAFQALNRGMNSFNLSRDAASQRMDRRLSNPRQFGMNATQDRNLGSNNVLNALPNPGNMYNIGNSMAGIDSASNNYQREQLLSNVLRSDEPQTLSQRSNTTQQQLANLAFGSNQHYAVLKEHHMNLLKELQETTTLMNMYHNNSQNSLDNYGSLMANRSKEAFDPFALEQSNMLTGGSNQLYHSSQSRSNSLGLGSVNMQMAGMQNLQNFQLDAQLANARRDSLLNANFMLSMASSSESRNDGDTNFFGERKRMKEDHSKNAN